MDNIKIPSKTIFLRKWNEKYSTNRSFHNDLSVETIDGEIVLTDATTKLESFFRKFSDDNFTEKDSAELDKFLKCLEMAEKISFVDTVFDKNDINTFCETFGFQNSSESKILLKTNFPGKKIASKDAIGKFIEKTVNKKLRVAAVFVNREAVKPIIDMLRTIQFPLNIVKMYFDPAARDLATKTDFTDAKILMYTMDSCWGPPLTENFDYVFGFFGGCNRKILSWEVTKVYRKFPGVKKFIYCY